MTMTGMACVRHHSAGPSVLMCNYSHGSFEGEGVWKGRGHIERSKSSHARCRWQGMLTHIKLSHNY